MRYKELNLADKIVCPNCHSIDVKIVRMDEHRCNQCYTVFKPKRKEY